MKDRTERKPRANEQELLATGSSAAAHAAPLDSKRKSTQPVRTGIGDGRKSQAGERPCFQQDEVGSRGKAAHSVAGKELGSLSKDQGKSSISYQVVQMISPLHFVHHSICICTEAEYKYVVLEASSVINSSSCGYSRGANEPRRATAERETARVFNKAQEPRGRG